MRGLFLKGLLYGGKFANYYWNLGKNLGKNYYWNLGKNLGKNYYWNLGKNLGKNYYGNLGKNLGIVRITTGILASTSSTWGPLPPCKQVLRRSFTS